MVFFREFDSVNGVERSLKIDEPSEICESYFQRISIRKQAIYDVSLR